MKKLLTLAVLGSVALSAFGQGKIVFNNTVSTTTAVVNPAKVNAPVYLDSIAGGVKLAAGYSAALLGGATSLSGASITLNGSGLGIVAESSMGALVLLSSPTSGASAVAFRTGAAAGYANVGTDSLRDSLLAYGTSGNFQMVAWNGAYTTWADAFNAWSVDQTKTVKIGVSAVLNRPVSTSSTDLLTPNLQGLASFAIVAANPVPEPTTLALAGLGAAALMIFRRRQ